jgi:Fe-S-cluster containining protein
MQTLCESTLNTIFDECRQCGTCCKKYRKILLQPDETAFITRMGGHVGVDVSLDVIREKGIDAATREAKERGRVYMIHPDDKGCLFLEKRNDKYVCKIYHYRPRTCRGFRCNLADNSFYSLFGDGAIHLLGQTSFGLPLAGGKE